MFDNDHVLIVIESNSTTYYVFLTRFVRTLHIGQSTHPLVSAWLLSYRQFPLPLGATKCRRALLSTAPYHFLFIMVIRSLLPILIFAWAAS